MINLVLNCQKYSFKVNLTLSEISIRSYIFISWTARHHQRSVRSRRACQTKLFRCIQTFDMKGRKNLRLGAGLTFLSPEVKPGEKKERLIWSQSISAFVVGGIKRCWSTSLLRISDLEKSSC